MEILRMTCATEPFRCRESLPSRAARRIAKQSKGHSIIEAVLGDEPGRRFGFESNLEKRVGITTYYRADVIDLYEQAPGFEWVDTETGEVHVHYLDFVATFVSGVRIGLIVKPEELVEKGDWRRKAQSISDCLPRTLADKVCILTEHNLDPVDEFNSMWHHDVQRPDPEADTLAEALVRDQIGAARLGDLRDRLGLQGRGFRALVRQIKRGNLRLLNHEKIGPEALAAWGGK
jgi:hypothetical protein